eukprot:scaffold544_cov117-Isochrysis_galbana.AAC.21
MLILPAPSQGDGVTARWQRSHVVSVFTPAPVRCRIPRQRRASIGRRLRPLELDARLVAQDALVHNHDHRCARTGKCTTGGDYGYHNLSDGAVRTGDGQLALVADGPYGEAG